MYSVKTGEIKIFSGSSNPKLAKEIADKLGVTMANCTLGKFSDGETSLVNRENSHAHDVFVVQPTSGCINEDGTINSVNDSIMELAMLGKSIKNSRAGNVTAVIPYFGYARQDRKIDSRDCITAQLAAEIIENAGFDEILVMDLHAQQVQGFFHKALVHGITARYIIEDWFREKIAPFSKEEIVVASPDAGSYQTSYKLAKKLGVGIIAMSKSRPAPNQSEVTNINGDVKGKICLMRDDMIDTAGTITGAAHALKAAGAKGIYIAATHGVLSGPAIERLKAAPITEIALMETIAIPPSKTLSNMHFLPTSGIFAEFILKMHMGYDLNEPLPQAKTLTPKELLRVASPKFE